jgi:NosR/NirI family nitrous oxide reductase transcriptional regulator
LIFFFQNNLVRRPKVYTWVRRSYLLFILVWLGWYANAQLSVVNVLTFANSLLTGFSWEYFLSAPLIFLLWGVDRRRTSVLGARAILRLAMPVRRAAGVA